MKKVKAKSDIDILEIAMHYVDMRQASDSEWRGTCPLPDHDDSTPSFFVNVNKGMWKCWGCDEGGDVFDLVIDAEDTDFKGALSFLHNQFDYDFSSFRGGHREDSSAKQKSFEILEVAADIMCKYLLHGKVLGSVYENENRRALDYLDKRGFNLGHINSWKIGFCPSERHALVSELMQRGYQAADIIAAGLTKPGKGALPRDFFTGRIVLPIRDSAGRVIGFTGRDLYGRSKAKYINSPDSDVFHKGEALLGIDRVPRKEADVVIVEGAFDVVRVHALGAFGVASLGTAFRESHATQLVRRRVKTARLLFDGDAAGHKATLKTAELLLQEDIKLYIATMPDGIDPGDLPDRESLRLLLNNSVGFVEYFLTRANPQDYQEKYDALKQLVAILDEIPSDLDVKRNVLLHEAMERLGLSSMEMPKLAKTASTVGIKKKAPSEGLSKIEEDLVWAFITHPEHPAVSEMLFLLNAPEHRARLSKYARRLIAAHSTPEMHTIEDVDRVTDIKSRKVEDPNFERLLALVTKWATLSSVQEEIELQKPSEEEGLLEYVQRRKAVLTRTR